MKITLEKCMSFTHAGVKYLKGNEYTVPSARAKKLMAVGIFKVVSKKEDLKKEDTETSEQGEDNFGEDSDEEAPKYKDGKLIAPDGPIRTDDAAKKSTSRGNRGRTKKE